MSKKLLLVTKQLPLFIKLSTFCNDEGNFIYNTTDPYHVLDIINHKQLSGIIWDMTVTDTNISFSILSTLRKKFWRPIIVLDSHLNPQIGINLFKLHVDDYLSEEFPAQFIIYAFRQRVWAYHLDKHPGQSMNTKISLGPAIQQIKTEPTTEFTNSEIIIDTEHYKVSKNNKKIDLTPKEFKLLNFLVDYANQILSRDQLLQGIWGYDNLGTSRIVDIHISHLRDKIEKDPTHPQHLKTVRGFGYSFEGKVIKHGKIKLID
ncbi:winged-helix domain-containing protein [Ligilactobacillus salivarius]|uniref:Winged-helix domain-containing protein n=1 Tax=Ligilactobacillus salivarius TaxID=1624 RepID=A0ABD7YW40_9LACO|nr:winged-helix domain-containing protein [Ligilactobacillus salivarius]URI12362.1 winged-helix domain-containing protein [Ligilactobacillus salivarius]UUB34187.1 winged-helix domain-containing protein [Ligilactobacillus salivarius]WHS06959.1 winged-helix domain-containing protein [Ligilactobacillus salivarius]WHS08637.1 winged-helix domain-containing protein [Ligilactobacillus salivarius]WHS09198.1 winged-helix domain-containing protein [Ligilactobacillus salivarius]